MEYFIVEYPDKAKLEEEIEACLKDGWKLQGGIATSIEQVHTGAVRYWYHQAMTNSQNDANAST